MGLKRCLWLIALILIFGGAAMFAMGYSSGWDAADADYQRIREMMR